MQSAIIFFFFPIFFFHFFFQFFFFFFFSIFFFSIFFSFFFHVPSGASNLYFSHSNFLIFMSLPGHQSCEMLDERYVIDVLVWIWGGGGHDYQA